MNRIPAQTPLPPLDSWEQVRAQFSLSPKYRHFACFFLPSHPRPVRQAIDSFRDALDAEPVLTVMHGMAGSDAANLLLRVRRDAADYVGGKADEIALVPNTTTGVALAYLGVPLKVGDEILVTTHDHYIHHEAIRLACTVTGASVRKVSLYDAAETASSEGIVTRIREAIRPATRVLGLTWVHSSTGLRLPLCEIAEVIADVNRERSASDQVLTIVDGVHGLGAVDELVAASGVDFFCSGTHKWIFGPRGTGIVWASKENWARLRPLLPTTTAPEAISAWLQGRSPQGPVTASWISPGGFVAFEHQWALGTAFQMHAKIGRSRVAARIAELNDQLKQGLSQLPRVTLHTPRSASLSAGITCFEVEGMSAAAVTNALLDHGIVSSPGPYAVSYARLSPGLMNMPEEVDEVLTALRAIVGG
jgi:isopenicillin-N epimerase